MVSERLQRRIERLLDRADAAADEEDWDRVAESAQMALALDAENAEAQALLAMVREAGTTAESVIEATRPAADGSSAITDVGAHEGGPQPSPTRDSATSISFPPTPATFANGRYEVRRFLGEGGKKRVYLAHDSLLGRDVAFALIKTEGLDQSSKERIAREAQAMGRLGVHPNIVAVLDLGQEEDGSPFIVTELMSGGDVEGLLSSRPAPSPSVAAGGADPSQGEGSFSPPPLEGGGLEVGRNVLSLERVIDIARSVCEGLEFAHARSIVHRDLKPGNVWLAEDGTAKIGDFGLAMMTDRSRLTRDAMMIGTPFYMPPEQATGGDMTPRSDLYSLGAMLYEMVTGRPPFLGDDEIAVISQHLNTPPVAPTWHNGDCPRPLEALIMRLLAKDPAERPESARDVYNALDAIDLTSRGETVEHETTSLESLAGGVFVGRQAEMDQLKAALEDVLGGRGRLVTLVGEPGIGKTRTSEELATYAGLRGAQVLWGRCYETGGQPPYWPWVQAIRSYVREIDADELRRQMGSSASVVAEIVTDVKDRLPEIEPPQELDDPDSSRFRLFDSITSFLKSAGESQPIVLILDDLHWSDRPSLTFLEFIARELSQSRVMLICTYRDMELNRRHPLTVTLGDLARERLYERVLLRGLTDSDVGRFIEIAAGFQPPLELSATVHRHTEGNPLFVTEVVRELVQSGELTDNLNSRDSTWSVRIPEGVREVIGRRLDRLSERTNELLTVAAVVGRDFHLETLRSLAEDTPDSQLLDVLDEALGAKIIEELPDEVGHYQFTHALMQETLTSELSLTRRVRMHARIAETLERRYGDASESNAAELAYHFAAAEAILGTEKLIRYSLAAGEAAFSGSGFEDARGHFQAAYDAIDREDQNASLAAAMSGLGRSILRVPEDGGLGWQGQEGWDLLSEAFNMYLEIGDQQSAIDLAQFPAMFGPLRGTAPVLKRAVDIVDPSSLEAGRINARYSIALVDDLGDVAGAHAALDRAEDLARKHGDAVLKSRVMVHRVQAWEHENDPWSTVGIGDEIIAAVEAADDDYSRVRLGPWLARAYFATGDTDKADRVLQRSLEVSLATREPVHIRNNRLTEAIFLKSRGDFEGARKPIADFGNGVRFRNLDWWLGIETGGWDGDMSQVPVDVEHLEMMPRRSAFVLAEALAEAGRTTSSDQLLGLAKRVLPLGQSEAIVLPREVGSRASAIAFIAAMDGPSPEAESAYQDLLNFKGATDLLYFHPYDRLLGLLASTLGRYDAAPEHFEGALDLCRLGNLRPELAWTLSDYSEMLLDRGEPGDREKATELQDEALTITRELGMRPLTERILARREILRA